MSFSKFSNLEAYTSNVAIKEIKGRTMVSNKQNAKTKLLRWVLCS